jgi:hypothetical protein
MGRLERLRSLLGAAMLAVGAVFETKVRPDDHWSVTPKIETIVDAGSDASGDPPHRRRRTLPATA